MKTDVKAKLYRKVSRKVSMDKVGIVFWREFKRKIDVMIYECSYKTSFDPTPKNITEREILCELQNTAVLMIRRVI